jgi:hypothetical protein
MTRQEEEEQRGTRSGVPTIDLNSLDTTAPRTQQRPPDPAFVKEVQEGKHAGYAPFYETSDGSVPNIKGGRQGGRMILETEHAPDAPQAEKRFVDLGDLSKQPLMFTDDETGITPAEAKAMYGRGMHKDAGWTSSDLGRINIGLPPSNPMNRSYMKRPDALQGSPEDWGIKDTRPVTPINNTRQVNTSTAPPPPTVPADVNMQGLGDGRASEPLAQPLGYQPVAPLNFDPDARHDARSVSEIGATPDLVPPHLDSASPVEDFHMESGLAGSGVDQMYGPQAAGLASRAIQPVDVPDPKGVSALNNRSLVSAGDVTISDKAQKKLSDPLGDKNTPLNRLGKKGAGTASAALGKGYDSFNKLWRNEAPADMGRLDKTSKWMDKKAATAWKAVSDNKYAKKAMAVGGKVLKKAEIAVRNPYAQIGLAALDGVFAGYDYMTDDGLEVPVMNMIDPETGKLMPAENRGRMAKVDAGTFDAFNTMAKDVGLFDGYYDSDKGQISLADMFGAEDSMMLPKSESDFFFSGVKRPTGAKAVRRWLEFPTQNRADAGDDAQMAFFVAQSLQLMRDAQSWDGGPNKVDTGLSMEDAKRQILTMANDFITQRYTRKNAEYAAHAKGRDTDNVTGEKNDPVDKAMQSFFLKDVNWKDPHTGENREGSVPRDNILSWSMFGFNDMDVEDDAVKLGDSLRGGIESLGNDFGQGNNGYVPSEIDLGKDPYELWDSSSTGQMANPPIPLTQRKWK